MPKRWLLPALLLSGAIIFAIVWLSGPPDLDTNRQQNTSKQIEGTALAIQWHSGVAQRYRIVSVSSMQMAAAANNPSAIEVNLHSLLDTQTLEVGQEIIIGMKLSNVDLRINGSVDADTNRALSTPFRVGFAENGMPVTFGFPAEVSIQQRKILENLIRMFQVSIDTKADTWVVKESNGNGSYDAVYRRSGPLQIDKSKRNFIALPTSMLTGAEIASTEQLRLAVDHDWLSAMHIDETLHTATANGQKMTIKNQATLNLQADVRPKLSPDLWRFASAAATVDDTVTKLSQPVPDISAAEARKRILATIPELDKAKQGRLTLVHQLRDLLRVDDSLPAVLLDILQTQQLSDRTRADLYLAFEQAGTDSAQAALVSVFTDTSTWSLSDAMRAIVAMGGVAAPNQDSIAALWNTAMDTVSDRDSQRIASGAAYALGSLANTMKSSGSPDYASLRSSLLSNALSGVNTQQRSDFVFAIGNTQDSTLAHEIVGMLDENAPTLRRATALSLGMLDVDQVADTLAARFQQEQNRQVRSAIAESLVSWSAPSAAAMAMFRETVTTDADESTRYQVALILGKNLASFPENEPVLREIMRSEPSKRIRQKVGDMLSSR